MDPNACLRRFKEALAAHDYQEAKSAHHKELSPMNYRLLYRCIRHCGLRRGLTAYRNIVRVLFQLQIPS